MGLGECFPVCPATAECLRIGVRYVYVIETAFSFSNKGTKIASVTREVSSDYFFFYILFFCQGKKTKIEGHFFIFILA